VTAIDRSAIPHPRTTPHELTRAYGGLLVHAARRVSCEVRLPCRREELIGFGVTGLLEAHQRFDPTRGVRFASFAYHRVRGAMIDGVRAMLPLSRRAYQMGANAEAAIARGAEVDRAILGRLSATFAMTALDLEPELAPADPDDLLDGDGDGRERVTRPVDLDAEGALGQHQMLVLLRGMLGDLTREEQIVVRGMYFEERCLGDIGAELGISKSWACRIHTRALRVLRTRLAAAMGGDACMRPPPARGAASPASSHAASPRA